MAWCGTGGWAARVMSAALLLVAACGGEEPVGAPPPDTPPLRAPTVSPVDPVAAAEQAALAAYTGMWDAYNLAGQPPEANPNHPDLARYASGDALEMLTDLLAGFRDDGLVFSGELELAPEVTRLSPQSDPDSARVEDCVDSSGWAVVRADGEPYEDEPGGQRLVFADVEDTGEGVWKVTVLSIGSVGSC